MQKAGGANGRLAGEMMEKMGPLIGTGALDTIGSSANVRAGIEEAQRIFTNHVETIKRRLNPQHDTRESGGKIQTLGKSKQSLDFAKE